MQQMPARDEELGPLWRSIFIPDEGKLWASMDFSSQEPRCTIHYAVKAQCQGAQEMAERFRNDPRTDLHQATADLCAIKRKDAKTIFLGLCYSMGGAKLCRSLGLPTTTTFSKRQGKTIEIAGEAGQAIIDKFHQMVPFVKELTEKVRTKAALRGYIHTLGGRRCRFPIDKDKSTDHHIEYLHLQKGLNKLIQSSSADQTKTAMVEIDRAGLPMQLQVHDEICTSVKDRKQAEQIAEIMAHCITLEIPSVVDVEIGPSWGDAK
jgi:DNA polymerase I-like protein with 3'-5' exonuclease and polymerase domains